jgi:hypothetical protein
MVLCVYTKVVMKYCQNYTIMLDFQFLQCYSVNGYIIFLSIAIIIINEK